ncbi:efflux RND transporter periplasmic adaptor subunit [Marinilongibacter aquaticus]|uniref:efflux RND transporter periplasmic adaptor subunit n=1 Tax=Marinilongibacter aquaticus TaxID=2975157 RepID=UPI0021BDDFC6|nr:efflux RND transporter periplasmic adaptor subunit [Marinilongibacter aquaticus]UBM59131.1 efflux RND transporter periplasmic adaptor subunit [Marinilongibacter aquaticus]
MNKSLKNTLTIAVVLAVIGLVGYKLVSNKHVIETREATAIAMQNFDVVPVKTYTVATTNFDNSLVQSGTFTPNQELKLNAQAQGQIKTLAVKKTQYVQKGALLATIDNSALANQILTAEASLEKAKLDAQRMHNSLETGGVTKQQVENAELQVKSSEANLAQLKQQSANYRIVAPTSGIVNEIFVEEGSFVAPGTPLVQLVDITKVLLTVSVNQEMLPSLKLGQRVKVSTDVYPDLSFNGKIETVNVESDASQKFKIGISVTNSKQHPILVGMFGKAEFLFDHKAEENEKLAIPRAAIVGSILDPQVYVVNSDSTVALRNIKAGRSFDKSVEVLEGLQVGETVVTAGQINLEAGRKVIIKN